MSRRILSETEKLWSDYDNGACGTAYLKNKMAEIEVERDEMVKLAQELRDALNLIVSDLPKNRDWLNPDTEKIAKAILEESKEVLP